MENYNKSNPGNRSFIIHGMGAVTRGGGNKIWTACKVDTSWMGGGRRRCEGEAKRFQTYFLITDMQCFLALLWVNGYFQFLGQGGDDKFWMCHYEGGGEKFWMFYIFWVLKEHIKIILRKYGDWLVKLIRISGGAHPFPSLEYWGFSKRVANFMHPVKNHNHDFHLDSKADKHAGVVKIREHPWIIWRCLGREGVSWNVRGAS